MSSTIEFFDVNDPPSMDQLLAVAGTDNRIVIVGPDDNPLMTIMDARTFDDLETELHRLTEQVADLVDQVDDLEDRNSYLEDDVSDLNTELRAQEEGEAEPTTSVEEAVQAFARHASSGECNG